MTIHLAQFFDFYSKRHYEFNIGWAVVGQATALLSFETFAMIFCEKFGISGTPSLIIYAGLPIFAIVGVTFMGYKMIQSGYATKLSQYSSNVNTDWQDLCANAAYCRKKLEEEKE